MRYPIISAILVISSLVFAYLHDLALANEWFFFYPWFDIPMHFLGGVIVSLFLLYVIKLGGSKGKNTAMLVVIGTFLIAFIWEVFEHIFNISIEPILSIDTLIDLLMGLLGALIVVALYSFRRARIGSTNG